MNNHGERIYLRFLNVEDAPALLDLQLRNRAVFEEISASERSETFYTLEGQVALLEGWNKAREEGKRYSFGIFLNHAHELIGEISLFELELDSISKWIVGYVLDQARNGKGYMSEALRLVLNFAVNDAGIKRVEAGALPDNAGSIRVLRKAGFQETDRQNIKIKGIWKEHVMFAVDLQQMVEQRNVNHLYHQGELMNKRKQMVLDSALVLFERHGVTNTSIQMILDESGVSKGIFYKILWFKGFVFLPFWSSVCRKT